MGTGNVLTLVRGLPGSGKSTLAKQLRELSALQGSYSFHFEADMYFVRGNGEYVFRTEELPAAHAWCQQATRDALARYGAHVIVSNTFSQMWELKPYLEMAKNAEARVQIFTVETTLSDEELAARNVHKCPVETIARIRNRWEPVTGGTQ
jgi:predicted kinase